MSRCGTICRRALLLIALLAAAMVLTLVGFRESAIRSILYPDTSFIKSLKPIRRVHWTELDLGQFRSKHVLQSVPLIIELQTTDMPLWDRESFLQYCSHRKVSLISRATAQALHQGARIASEDSQHRIHDLGKLLDLSLRIFTRGGVENLTKARSMIPLAEVAQQIDRADAAGVEGEWSLLSSTPSHRIWTMALLARWSPIAAMIDAFLRVVLGPTYLHDQAVDQVCPELERNGGSFAAAYARQASFVDPGWLAEMLQVNSSEVVVDKRNEPLQFFWGAKGSVAYPLHWDVVDGDNFMQMLQGCKEVVILQEDEGMTSGDVLASNIPGTTSFAFDPFDASADTSGGPLVGWYGEIKAGDLLFMPGNSLHHIRNKCKDTVSIGTRPWLHSAVKEAAMQNNISVPFSIRENFCLRSGITCTTHRKKHWKKAPMANLGFPAKALNRDGAGSKACSSQPTYFHGESGLKSIDLELTAAELVSAKQSILANRALWRKRKIGSEDSMSNVRELISKEARDQLYYYTMGAASNYDSKKTGAHSSNFASANSVLEKELGWLYNRIRVAIARLVAPDALALVPGHNFYLHIYSGEIVRGEGGPLVKSLIAAIPMQPHLDRSFMQLDWPNDTNITHSLSFTLPLVLPAEGSGMRTYHVWCNKTATHLGLDAKDNATRCIDANREPVNELSMATFQRVPYTDWGYVPGTMVVNNGDQYHCLTNFVDLIPDDLRITVQGHGIFSEGAWRLFA